MFGLRLGAMGRVGAGLTLTQQAINILRRPGLESHVYMPGVGWVNGLSLTNSIMEDGTQAASVDNPMGYMGDPIATVGPELVTNGDFSNGTTGWTAGSGWSIGSGVASAAGVTADGLRDSPSAYVTGRVYQVSFDKTGTAAMNVYIRTSAVTIIPAGTTGRVSVVIVAGAGATRGVEFYVSSAVATTIDNISVRELVGAIPARQATTANKPILRRGAVNRLLQTGFTGGTDGTVGAGAVAPTGWTFGFSGGTVAYVPAASGQGNAIRFVATAGRPMIQQNFTVLASMTYLLHMRVDAVVGSVRADIAAGFGGLPAGATQTWRVNGVAGGATLLQAGDKLEVLMVIGATAGTVQPRIGLGAVGSATGDITLANPQLETGSTASPYIPTTTAAASSPTGPYWMEFDGTDFLSLAAVPFQQADDHCVIAGAANQKASGAAIVFALAGPGAEAVRCAQIFYSGGQVQASWTDDGGIAVSLSGPTPAMGANIVASVRKSANTRVLRVNGTQSATDTRAMGATTLGTQLIGAHRNPAANHMLGAIYPVIVVKGTVTDAELATLERWVGQLSGVQL